MLLWSAKEEGYLISEELGKKRGAGARRGPASQKRKNSKRTESEDVKL
jgi:hypothetical protein